MRSRSSAVRSRSSAVRSRASATASRSAAACRRWLLGPLASPISSEYVRGRLPLPEPLRDELGALLRAPAVQRLEVCGVGAEVDAGGSGIQPGVAIGPCRAVAGGAVRGLHLDLAGALELRGIRVSRALTLPVVEDAGRVSGGLRHLAPVASRQGAVLLPCPAAHGQVTGTIPRDAQEAHCRRFLLAPHG